MKKRALSYTLSALILVGCSAKSNFYQLTPTQSKHPKSYIKKDKIIAIAPIEIADYIDKPQIITRIDNEQLSLHELDRWAGAIDKNIQSVIRYDLMHKLPRYTILTKPLPEPIDNKYTLYIHIDRFDGDINGSVVLDGRWSLIDENEDRFIKGKNIHYKTQANNTLPSIISTQSKLLDRLASDIAREVR
jgi:uncharacterized lipoprotein YmbA